MSRPIRCAGHWGVMAAALFVSSGAASAATLTWAGGSDNWSNAPSWGGSEPTNADVAQLNNGDTITVNAAGEVAERLHIGIADGGSGTVAVGNGGSLGLGRLYLASNMSLVGATMSGTITQTGGAVSVSTQTWIGGNNGTSGAGATGTYNLQGGTLTLTHSAANTRIGRNGSTGIVHHSGGSWISNGMFISSQVSSSGANSTGTYSASGTATMSLAGRLYVSSANLAGDSGTTASPNGTFNVTGSDVTINTFGYSQGAGGALNFIADADGISTINASFDTATTPGRGETNLAGNVGINLAAMTATPSVLLLIHNTSTNLVSGAFANAPAGTVFGSYQLTYTYAADGDSIANDVALVPVPEPAAAAAMLLAVPVLLSTRIRRKTTSPR